VNLVDRQIEIRTEPSGPIDDPTYGRLEIARPGETVALFVGGAAVGTVRVEEVLP
jgi:hypothetical protein